jgi:ATP-dependent helicase/nuclease subunit A
MQVDCSLLFLRQIYRSARNFIQISFWIRRARHKKKFLTKDLAEAHAGLVTQIEDERDRVCPLLEKRRIAHTVARTKILVAVVHAIISTYRRDKEARGLLDFGDLIVATRKLLKRTEASWVLEKLDRGIDHILVDEAQDTSPEQWDILEAIAEEFTAGRGQREITRTFFAVGDEKQSIFSFQGARPDQKRPSTYLKRSSCAALSAPALPLWLLSIIFFRWPPISRACPRTN